MVILEESGLRFGDYPEGTIFEIEKHTQGFKKVEFVYSPNQNSLLFLEAKTSIARNPETRYMEIKEKFIYSLAYIFAGKANYNQVSKNHISKYFSHNILSTKQLIYLILVVPDIPDEMLSDFTTSFQNELSPLTAAYGIPKNNVLVLNKRLAEKKKLIVSETTST